jgi:hypothetical protein
MILNFVIFVTFVVEIGFSLLVAALPRWAVLLCASADGIRAEVARPVGGGNG